MQRAYVRRWWGLLLVLACLGPLSRAAAQEQAAVEPGTPPTTFDSRAGPRASTPNPMQAAREQMERGQALYAAARYLESAEEFLRAYEAQPFAAFLFNAGVAYEKLDDPGHAADYFARYLQADPQARDASQLNQRIDRLREVARAREQQAAAAAQAESPDAAHAQRAQAELADAKRQLGELETQLAALGGRDAFKSLLSVQSTPADATISLKTADGQLLEEHAGSPFSHTLDQGKYLVEVQHPKYDTISTPLDVAPGKVHVIMVALSEGQLLGFLRVISDVPGACVYVDKKEAGALGSTPFQNATPTGAHHLWIEKAGYEPIERDIALGVGDDVLLRVALERVDHGRIRVVANRAEAEVLVDGQFQGRVPQEIEAAPGSHALRVRAPGMKDWLGQVEVERGQATPVRVRLRPKMDRTGAWVTVVAAAGVLAGAIGTGVAGRDLQDHLRRDRDSGVLRSDDKRFQRGKVLYILSDVSYALTLGLAGLATYYFLRDTLPDSEGSVLQPRDWAFHPYLGPSGAGGNLHVSF